jgi:hypothetical protein
MMAMSAVLNFRPGNRPTSLDQILEKHRYKGITRDEFKNFHKSFFATLNNFISDTKSRERDALNEIFREVTDYMISECVGSPGEKHVSVPDGANANRLPGSKKDVRIKTRCKEKSVGNKAAHTSQ